MARFWRSTRIATSLPCPSKGPSSTTGWPRRRRSVTWIRAWAASVEEREQPRDQLSGQGRSVLAAFERLGVAHLAAALGAVEVDQQVAVALGRVGEAPLVGLGQPDAPLGL